MLLHKRTGIIAGLALAITVLAVNSSPAGTKREFVNLKVLPKDISSKDLQHIMIDEFEDGLGRSLYQSQSSLNREGNSGQGAYMADESILQGNLHKGGHKHGQNTDKILDQDFFNGKFGECY